MERLTTSKDVSEMGMYELAHNGCYIKDGEARYRDSEMDMSARDFARNLMTTLRGEDLPVDDDEFDEEILENLQYDPFADTTGLIALFYRNLWAMADLRERLKEYEDLEDRLNGISVKQVVHGFIKTVENQTCEGYEHGRILTNAEADKWNEYKQLEEQGLLLRFPCKVGDTVYAICTCEEVDTVLDGTLYGSNGGFGTATGYYCPYELSDKCPHIDADDCDECKNIESVFEDTIDYINITECEILIGLKNTNLCVTVDEIGKTVFLTKSEAEQKLKEMESELYVSTSDFI